MKKTSILLFLLLFLIGTGKSQEKYPFQNPNLATEKRIDNLLSLMTLDEKVACLSTVPDIPRLGVKGTGHVEGLHGLAQGGPSDWGRKNPQPTTTFPQAYGLGETWDIDAVKKVAEIEAFETRYMWQHYKRGGLVVRAPNADVGRDIRWGRTEECYGEDAWFNARMTVAFVKGLQGKDPKYWEAAALMKHFLANSNENSRDSSSSNFNERLFREYYSYPFYKGISEGGCRAFMASYNAYNGIPMTVHPVLKEITQDEWGQNGIICTDGGAYTMLVTAHHHFPDFNKAAAGCLKAGINQFLDNYREGVYGALANGYLQEKHMDNVLRGVFRVMIKLGQLDDDSLVAYKKNGTGKQQDPTLLAAHKGAARRVTQKSIVLLKNNGLLPLDEHKLQRIALIGTLADTVMLDWYSGTPPYFTTLKQRMEQLFSKKAIIDYAPDNRYNRAVEIAKKADVAIVMVGNDPTCQMAGWGKSPFPSQGKEAVDRKTIDLEQEALIKKIFAANPNTLVILQSSFPYAINWTQENVPAILHVTHSSQETGLALTDVILGYYNPAGRLTQTWPSDIDQLLPMMEYDITKGATYMYSKHKPLYAFGFGLSYTTFQYSNLKLDKKRVSANDTLHVSVDVKNTGMYDGDEVVQVYVHFIGSKVKRPQLKLCAFDRIEINAGKSKTVKLHIPMQDLAYWSIDKKCFVVEPLKMKIQVGGSSDKLVLDETFTTK